MEQFDLYNPGRTDPVPFLVKLDALGLGKASYDERIIESTVSQRRELDSERMTKETELQRRQREVSSLGRFSAGYSRFIPHAGCGCGTRTNQD